MLRTTSNSVLTTDDSCESSSARDFDSDAERSLATSKNISGQFSSASIEPLTSIRTSGVYSYRTTLTMQFKAWKSAKC